jgi:tripartite-type tricarboxylate transporter receptor subunit TctC
MTRYALAFCLAAAWGAAGAQYPSRPVRLVVSSSPGGGTDTTARIVSAKLTELLGQQIVVENRPGASSQIGSDYVARSAPDGYTLLMTASSVVIAPSTFKKTSFDPIRDFAPISQIVVVPQLVASHPSIPVRNLRELIAFVKARPGKLDYSAGNYGGHPHVTMALFMTMAGLDAAFIPYKSGNAGLVDALSGEVPLMLGNMLSTLPHVRAGKLRAYGVTSPGRASGAPDIPTIAEAGVPGYESVQWFGMLAPAATPREIVNRLHRDVVRAVQDSDTRRRFQLDGGEATWSASPEEFSAFMRAELVKWAKVVKDARIIPQ